MESKREIRNFCIVAHIDHGKSTLADRLLEITGTVDPRKARNQILDDMDLERERGITIKARAVSMFWEQGGKEYLLNLIDTPGHVDFAYEVSRALTACEGALLVVDASQGIEAQTVANCYLAVEHDLEIIPVLNKVDLPSARPDEIAMEIESVFGFDALDCITCSAKTGQGIDDLLTAICQRLPGPKQDVDAPTRALIFDSVYDDYRGVMTFVRVFEGRLKVGDTIRMMQAGRTCHLTGLGKMTPKEQAVEQLEAGEVEIKMTASA